MSASTELWGFGRKALLSGALLVLVLLPMVELGLRGLEAARGRPHDPAAVEAELLRRAEKVERSLAAFNAGREDGETHKDLKPRTIPSPFYGWEYEHTFDSLTKQAERFRSGRADDSYELAILGGSVAAAFEAQGSERLLELLGQDPRFEGRELKTLACARGGYKQPQQLNFLVFLLGLGWRPDAVLNIDGFNEVAISNQNAVAGAHPLHPSIQHWGHLLAFGRFQEPELDALKALREAKRGPRRVLELYQRAGLGRSAALSRLALGASARAVERHAKAQASYGEALMRVGAEQRLFGAPPPAELASVLELSVQGWEASSRALRAICEQRGILYVHCLQPTLYDEGSKPLTPEERRTSGAGPSWIDGARHGYPLLRAAGERLRAAGVHFVDATRVFEQVEETLYYDPCHVVARGNELLAEFLAPRFLAALPR